MRIYTASYLKAPAVSRILHVMQYFPDNVFQNFTVLNNLLKLVGLILK